MVSLDSPSCLCSCSRSLRSASKTAIFTNASSRCFLSTFRYSSSESLRNPMTLRKRSNSVVRSGKVGVGAASGSTVLSWILRDTNLTRTMPSSLYPSWNNVQIRPPVRAPGHIPASPPGKRSGTMGCETRKRAGAGRTLPCANDSAGERATYGGIENVV